MSVYLPNEKEAGGLSWPPITLYGTWVVPLNQYKSRHVIIVALQSLLSIINTQDKRLADTSNTYT